MTNEESKKNPYELSNTSAFGNFNNVSTSFSKGLENSIIEMVKSNSKIHMSEILEKFGNYPQVLKSVNRLILDNKIVLYELQENSYNSNLYDLQELKIADPSQSKWLDLSAQPCLTCQIYNECDINNPVSPANCEELNTWIQEEIELEFPDDL